MRQQYHFRKVNGDTLIWNVNKLVEKSKDLSIIKVPLAELDEQYNSVYWSDEKGLSCKEVVHHLKLIEEADLKYPILLCPEYKVIDGMHRLCKSHIEGQTYINARVLKELPVPDHINVKKENLKY